MARIIFINRYFFPDHSATSQILSDLTFHFAAVGHEVHVVTSKQIYDDPDAVLPSHERINQVNVHRVASTRFGRSALTGRALDYLSFYHSVRRCLAEIARANDTVVAKTDPPLLSVVVAPIARQRRLHLINWPASALAILRNHSLRRAAATVVVGELMARQIEAQGIEAARIHVISNWCDDEAIRPVAQANNPLRKNWQLADKFVVGYSGNLGRAHDFETILATAERLRDEARIVFLMIGGGSRFEKLLRAVKARGLEHAFRFQPYQDRALLPFSLGVPDVHWLSLDPRLEGLIVPSKFYGIAAAGRPMVMIGDGDGEIGRLVRQYRCGISVAPGEAATLTATLRRWSQEPATIAQMGLLARQMLEARFTRRTGLAHWSQLLDHPTPN